MSKDQLLQRFKTRHRYLYGAIRDTAKQVQGFRRRHHDKSSAVHAPQSKPTYPFSTITTNSNLKRLNLVFDRLDIKTISNQDYDTAIILASDFARHYHYHLRIITRNHQANPKLYLDFLKHKKITPPKSFSFYNDSIERLSPTTRLLDLSSNDVFFATSSSSLFAVQRTARPILPFYCLQSASATLPPEALPITRKADLATMKGWLHGKK